MAGLRLAVGVRPSRCGAVPESIINWKKQTARSSTEQVQTAGGVGFLFAYYCAASSILVAVNSSFPSTSLTVPVAVTFLDSLQSLPWNSLLTSLATKK